MPKRVTVLFGHCVDEPECNGGLPRDMKISRGQLTRIVDWFHGRYDVGTLGGTLEGIRSGSADKSAIALTMDDGYRDNATTLRPILAERGIGATVFLESRPLDERKVNWSHKMFWMFDQGVEAEAFARDYMLATEDAETAEKFRRLFEEGSPSSYHVKRILKYEADEAERDRLVDELFVAAGGDDAELCETLYMSWDQARELRDAGFELGGHTVNHVILSRLDEQRAKDEIGGCLDAMERELGERPKVFAYPFGRRWDYSDETCRVARECGVEIGVNTHAGTNDGSGDGLQLKRIPIDDDSKLHMLVAEACGGFDLLRKVGVDLSE